MNDQQENSQVFIEEVVTHNFKCLKGTKRIQLSHGSNYLVGNNNCGKTTFMQAIDYLLSGPSKNQEYRSCDSDGQFSDDTYVEATLLGSDFSIAIKTTKDMSEYVDGLDDSQRVRVRRCNFETTAQQSGESKKIKEGVLVFWNYKTKCFENPSGAKGTIRLPINVSTIWADMMPGDVVDFGSTKIAGQLLKGAVAEFTNSDEWQQVAKDYDKAVQNPESGLKNKVAQLEKQVSEIVSDQHGQAKFAIHFDPPGSDILTKGARATVEDDIITDLDQKGTGLQRAVALAMLQVLAASKGSSDQGGNLLLLDEPETFLHPSAQTRLSSSLQKLANEGLQIVLSTHSPYFLRSAIKESSSLLIFLKENNTINVERRALSAVNDRKELTIAEVNYHAFGVCSAEFMNELYGFASLLHEESEMSGAFDAFLKTIDSSERTWNKIRRGNNIQMLCSVATYVRHEFHHPENTANEKSTNNDLKNAIEILLKACKELSGRSQLQ